jgi:HAD superfamily hydrolase (TIGR01549 family)
MLQPALAGYAHKRKEIEMDEPGPGSSRLAVTLDLWQTLIAEADGRQYSELRFVKRAENVMAVVKAHGLLIDYDRLVAASREISKLVTADHDLGLDMQFIARVEQMLAMVDEHLPERLGLEGLAEVAAAIDQAFLDTPPSFLPGSKETLERLRDLGVGIGLISNTGMTSADTYRLWFEREGVLEYFDHLAFSNEVACAKPSPEIFHPTLAGLGVEPRDGLHIGDNLLTDISGAAGVGMRTGWISGHDDREPIVDPDYTLGDITDLIAVAERWLGSRRAMPA